MKFEKYLSNPESSQIDRFQITQRVEGYIRNGVSLERIAELLDVSDALTIQKGKGHGVSEVRSLRMDDIVDELARRSTPIRLPETITLLPDVILPSDEGQFVKPGSREGLREVESIPRLNAFMEIMAQLNLPYRVIDGINRETMMRGQSYQACHIGLTPELANGGNELVLINDEEGNATYIVYGVAFEAVGEWLRKTKSQLQDSPEVAVLRYSGSLVGWKQSLLSLLQENPRLVGGREAAKETADVSSVPELHYKEGWLSEVGIATEIGKPRSWVRARLESILIEHPDWVDTEAKNSNNQRVVCYSPEAFRELKRLASWMSMSDLSRLLRRSDSFLVPRLREIQQDHPYCSVGKGRRKLFDPLVLSLIRERVENFHAARPGWITRRVLAQRLKRTDKWVKMRLDTILSEHPDWVDVNALTPTNIRKDHFSPEVEALLQSSDQAVHEPKKGWITLKAIQNQVGESLVVIGLIKQLSQEHPEWVDSLAVDRMGHTRTHYDPFFVEELLKRKKITS